MVLSNVAGKEEVLERARKNLAENYNIDLTEEETEELYDITAKYIAEKLREKPFCSVQMNFLGTAFYQLKTCKEVKWRFNNTPKRFKIWEDRYDIIQDYKDSNKKLVNRAKRFKVLHTIKSIAYRNKKAGWTIEDIEEDQNNDN
jgi:hypothetical protein